MCLYMYVRVYVYYNVDIVIVLWFVYMYMYCVATFCAIASFIGENTECGHWKLQGIVECEVLVDCQS